LQSEKGLPLNISVPTPIPLSDCPGLIDLMLTGDERGPSFDIKDVTFSVEQVRGDAFLEAITPDFGLMVVFPGWYVGAHGLEVRILIVGDDVACLRWLPINRGEKLALIARLPFDIIDQTICTLAV